MALRYIALARHYPRVSRATYTLRSCSTYNFIRKWYTTLRQCLHAVPSFHLVAVGKINSLCQGLHTQKWSCSVRKDAEYLQQFWDRLFELYTCRWSNRQFSHFVTLAVHFSYFQSLVWYSLNARRPRLSAYKCLELVWDFQKVLYVKAYMAIPT